MLGGPAIGGEFFVVVADVARLRAPVLHGIEGALEEHGDIHAPQLGAEPEADGDSGIAGLIDPDAVVRRDLPVPVDVREDDVSGAGAGHVGVGVHGGLILEHADRLVVQAAVGACLRARNAHPVAGRTLPRGCSRSFVPELHFVLGISAVERDVVGDAAGELLAPGDRAVIAPARDPADVLAGQRQCGRLGHRGVPIPEDVAPPLVEAIRLEGEPIVEEATFEPDVDLIRDFPGDVGVGDTRLIDALLFRAAEDVPAAESVRGHVLPLVDPVIPRAAPGSAELQLVEQRHLVAEEGLFRDAPPRRDTGEEAETLALGEDVRAVVARDEFEEVLVAKRVIETREVILPRCNPACAAVGLLRIAAREQLIDLI